MIRCFLVIFAAYCLPIFAQASEVDDARGLFLRGEYDAAIDKAIAVNSAEGLLVAAETLSGKVMLQHVEDANDSAKQARKWAEDALEAMPESQEAHVQFALAYGFETRTSSPFRAWRKKLPNKTLEAIENVRTKYPDDPRGDALLGAWHLGVVQKAGAKNGEKWYGASAEAGVKYYEAAMKAAPGDIVIASNYVISILALDAELYLDRAREIMVHVETLSPQNAVEVEVITRIVKLQTLTHDKEALSAMALSMLDA